VYVVMSRPEMWFANAARADVRAGAIGYRFAASRAQVAVSFSDSRDARSE
jgi:hypothetical protein